ncbi:MAG: hypothetical protein SGPRY_012730 [Prymnesium sp.]
MPVRSPFERVCLADGSVRKSPTDVRVMQLPLFATREKGRKALCEKGCGQLFAVGAGLRNHERSCRGARASRCFRDAPEAKEEEHREEHQELDGQRLTNARTAARAVADAATNDVPSSPFDGNRPTNSEAEEEANTRGAAPPIVGQKRLKSGLGYKRSGLREGATRGTGRTLYFKYEVAQHYHRMMEAKRNGICDFPNDATAAHYHRFGMAMPFSKGTDRGKRKEREAEMVNFRCRAASKMTLHGGPRMMFAAAAAELYSLFREHRHRGLPYYSMTLRKRSNQKHLSVEERLPAIKRLQDRFRRRLTRRSFPLNGVGGSRRIEFQLTRLLLAAKMVQQQSLVVVSPRSQSAFVAKV